MYIIYMHTNCNTQKSYIGMTSKKLLMRWRQHVNAAKRHSKTIFHNSIRKHGEFCWKHITLEVHDSYEKARSAEINLISKYKTLECGYNMTPGGDGVHGLFGDKNPMWKKCHTQEAKEKISKAFRNKKLSTEHCKAISIGKQAMSRESRKRIGDGHKKFLHLKIERIDRDGNIKRYNNIYDAADDVKGEVRRILAVLNGTQKHHKGFLWRNA